MVVKCSGSNPFVIFPYKQQEESPFHQLPEELLRLIFENRSVKDLQQASFVCKKFRKNAGNLILDTAIKTALDRLINPDTSLLKKLAKSDDLIQMILGRIWQLESPTHQNLIIDTLIWTKQSDDKTLLNLFKTLYDDPKCSNGNRLHLLMLANRRGPLEKYKEKLIKFLPPSNLPTPEVKVFDVNSPFELKKVDPSLYSALLISPNNTFQMGELVAIDHEGNLIGKRKQLFYGVVLSIVQKDGKTLYKVSLDSNFRMFDLIVSPFMLGKIPKSEITEPLS